LGIFNLPAQETVLPQFLTDVHRPFVIRFSERIFQLIDFPLGYFNTSFVYEYDDGDQQSKLTFNQGFKNLGWENAKFNLDTRIIRYGSTSTGPIWLEGADLDLFLYNHFQIGSGAEFYPGHWQGAARLNLMDLSFIEVLNRFPDIPFISFEPEAVALYNTLYFGDTGFDGYTFTFNSGFSFLPFVDFALLDSLASPVLAPALMTPLHIWFIPFARTEDFRLATWELGFNPFGLAAWFMELYNLIGITDYEEDSIDSMWEESNLFDLLWRKPIPRDKGFSQYYLILTYAGTNYDLYTGEYAARSAARLDFYLLFNLPETSKIGWDYFVLSFFISGETDAKFLDLFDKDTDVWKLYLHVDFRTSFNPLFNAIFTKKGIGKTTRE